MELSLPDILIESAGLQGQLVHSSTGNDISSQQGLDFTELIDQAFSDTPTPEIREPQAGFDGDLQSIPLILSKEIQAYNVGEVGSAGKSTASSSLVNAYPLQNLNLQQISSGKLFGVGELAVAENKSSSAQLVAALVAADPGQGIKSLNPQMLETKTSSMTADLSKINSSEPNPIVPGALKQLFESPDGTNESTLASLTSKTLQNEELLQSGGRSNEFLPNQYNSNEHQLRQINSKTHQKIEYDWNSPTQIQQQAHMHSQLRTTDLVLNVIKHNKTVDQVDITAQNQHNITPVSASLINRVAPTTTQIQNTPLQSFVPISNTDVISKQIEMQIKNHGKVAEIQLDPPALGRVQVQVRMQGKQTIIEMNTHHAAGREALVQEMPRLKEFLQNQGVEIASININLSNDQSSGFFGQNTGEANFQNLNQENETKPHDNSHVQQIMSMGTQSESGISLFA
ncbi:MAG: flagellar hook-length control protein FliK [bacterium]